MGLDKVYTVQIEITCNDKPGLLANILAVPTDMKINISSVNAQPNKSNRTSVIRMGLDVRSSAQVQQILTRLRRMKDIYSVGRARGGAKE